MKNKEQNLIGNILNLYQDKKFIVKLLNVISEEDFIFEKRVFGLVKEAILNNKIPTEELTKNKIKVSPYLTSDFISGSFVLQKAKEVKENTTALKLQDLFNSYKTFTPDKLQDIVKEFQNKFLDLTRVYKTDNPDIKNIMAEYEKEQEFYKNKKGLIGLKSGFQFIDSVIDGIRKEHFWIIGGNTNSGKTFFALNILNSVLAQDKSVAFYSLEMSKVDIVSRILGIMSGLNGSMIFKGMTEVEEYKKALSEKRLSIYSELYDIDDIILSIMEEKMVNNIDVVFIDYLQILQKKKTNEEYDRLTKISSQLQDVAKRLKISIIGLSQLSNEAIRNRGEVIGLKGSGSLAASADLVLDLLPDDKFEERSEKLKKGESLNYQITIKKNRHGRVGFCDAKFLGSTGIFKQND